MSTTDRKLAVQRKWTATFYWIGIAMSVLCVALAFARNTDLISRLEPAGFPLSWTAGVIAIVAFLAAEYCHPAAPSKIHARGSVSEIAPDVAWQSEFAD